LLPFRNLPSFLLALALVAGCRSELPPDPEARARAFLDRSADAGTVRAAWLAERENWNLGLADEVAGSDPRRPFDVATLRDLNVPREGACSAEVRGSGSALFYRTTVSIRDGNSLAAFEWTSLDRATRGHRRVRAAVAASRGDVGDLWRRIRADPALDAACTVFRQQRDLCADDEGIALNPDVARRSSRSGRDVRR
jgi:hypothetical protein